LKETAPTFNWKIIFKQFVAGCMPEVVKLHLLERDPESIKVAYGELIKIVTELTAVKMRAHALEPVLDFRQHKKRSLSFGPTGSGERFKKN